MIGRMRITPLIAAMLALAGPADVTRAAQPAPSPAPAPPRPSPRDIVKAAPAADWVAIAPADLMVMDLAPDARARPRRVIIQLMPAPFSQGWVSNLRLLAKAHWWDGTSVYRVQDNYVAQWGDADGDGPDKSKAKPLPAGLAVVGEADYFTPLPASIAVRIKGEIAPPPPAAPGIVPAPPFPATHYAAFERFFSGWPIASDYHQAWPTHCYAMVGVARDLSPDTGTGAELYAVIGGPARALDRNIALVGRVIEGIEHLSSLPRGPGPLGVYADAGERVPIRAVRLASELPLAEQPRFEYRATDSAAFAAYADAAANRQDAFFIHPAGGVDICSLRVPLRRVAAK